MFRVLVREISSGRFSRVNFFRQLVQAFLSLAAFFDISDNPNPFNYINHSPLKSGSLRVTTSTPAKRSQQAK